VNVVEKKVVVSSYGLGGRVDGDGGVCDGMVELGGRQRRSVFAMGGWNLTAPALSKDR